MVELGLGLGAELLLWREIECSDGAGGARGWWFVGGGMGMVEAVMAVVDVDAGRGLRRSWFGVSFGAGLLDALVGTVMLLASRRIGPESGGCLGCSTRDTEGGGGGDGIGTTSALSSNSSRKRNRSSPCVSCDDSGEVRSWYLVCLPMRAPKRLRCAFWKVLNSSGGDGEVGGSF